jgi:hypothetical protein
LDGTELPPRLAATAQVFAAGRARLRHVEVVAGQAMFRLRHEQGLATALDQSE